jgi:hypothetical protein
MHLSCKTREIALLSKGPVGRPYLSCRLANSVHICTPHSQRLRGIHVFVRATYPASSYLIEISLTELALLLDDHHQRRPRSWTLCAKRIDLTIRRPWRRPHIYHSHGVTRLDGNAVHWRDADSVADIRCAGGIRRSLCRRGSGHRGRNRLLVPSTWPSMYWKKS